MSISISLIYYCDDDLIMKISTQKQRGSHKGASRDGFVYSSRQSHQHIESLLNRRTFTFHCAGRF